MADIYFSGQGNLFIADRDVNGNPTFFRNVGNVPALKLSLSTNVIDHVESQTGQRLEDLRLTTGKTANIELTLQVMNKENLKLMLYGTSTTVAGAVITNESIGSGRVVGDIVALAHPIVSALSVHDSTGSPLTLVLNTDYSVDLVAGMIKILNLGAYVQPFKVNYTYATTDIVPSFKAVPAERYLKFVGLNTANANNVSYVDIYRVVFDPVADLELINDQVAEFQLKGDMLYDSTRDADSTLGGFGRIIQTNPWA